ncbi:hypothetical protein LSTR_LSTR016054 [Laodelphax striatellus]|uniref:Secreted protein n=1 Tax=Laodelphax striatellus TaxID=195883 RepID=A0A482WPE0_LAOST|nr:hypothetical protein LSTR_LSTR016054 [Laodelphax striatellus]
MCWVLALTWLFARHETTRLSWTFDNQRTTSNYSADRRSLIALSISCLQTTDQRLWPKARSSPDLEADMHSRQKPVHAFIAGETPRQTIMLS